MAHQQGAYRATPPGVRSSAREERAIGLRDIFSLRRPRDLMLQAVRAQQIDTILRLAPITIAIQLLCGAVVLAALSTSVDPRALLAWFGVAGAVCAVRVGRAWRLRRDDEYEQRVPATFLSATLTVGLLSMFWLVPPIFWFDLAPPSAQLLMALVSAVLVSAGSLTFVSVPPAALAFVTVTLASTLLIALKLDSLDAGLAIEATTETEEKMLGGMRGTYQQLLEVLSKEGLEPIAAAGEPFDPEVHEAVMSTGEGGELIVSQELRRGYRLRGKVIRATLVALEAK